MKGGVCGRISNLSAKGCYAVAGYIGTADKVFFADKYKPVISQYTDVQVKLLQRLTHMGVVASPKTRPVIGEWLSDLDKL